MQVAIPRDGVDDPVEAVGYSLPASAWGAAAVADLDRVAAVLVGPGLGPGHDVDVATVLGVDRPLVLDGDALQPEFLDAIRDRAAPTVLTPHGGEFARLAGHPPRPHRRHPRTRSLDRRVVVHKGPTTIVADPDGPVLVVANGGPALATAGTGDVLAGAITALLAQGVDPVRAAASAAWLHAEAGREQVGLVASDLPDRLALLLTDG